jgi:hypothetical protein
MTIRATQSISWKMTLCKAYLYALVVKLSLVKSELVLNQAMSVKLLDPPSSRTQ